jgi:pantoate--beta-alanine ligase
MTRPALTHTRREFADFRSVAREPIAVVMTLGALHEAHRTLMREARRLVGLEGTVIVTIFVNPLQFGQGEDYDAYPRPLGADIEVCAAEGVDVVFAPSRGEMYPAGVPAVSVDPGPLATELEGSVRPTHFAGVLTVVAKLLNITRPDFAVFGEKDYQQLVLVRQMVTDLDLPYEVVAAPLVRAPDGLALSSRNAYLSQEDREVALVLSRSLYAGRDASEEGPVAVLEAASTVLREAGMAVDYLELRAPDLAPTVSGGPARLLVAAKVGATRLIDNVEVHLR